MKRNIFMAVLLMLSLSAAAQISLYGNEPDDAAYDDYAYDVANGLDLTGEQWHTNEASILAANNCQYIVVRGPARNLYTLGALNVPAYERLWHHRISLYRPYYYNGCLGWYAVAGLIHYFIYPDGRWCRLGYEPCYYPYRYHIAHCRRINFYDWHFWHGRHHHSYRGTCYHHRRPAMQRHNGYNHYRDQHYRKQPPARRNYDSRPPHRYSEPKRQPDRRYSEQQYRPEKRVSREAHRPGDRSVRKKEARRPDRYVPANRPDRSQRSSTPASRPSRRDRDRSGRH